MDIKEIQDICEKDTIVASIIREFAKRAKFGHQKYGVTMDREDIDLEGWLTHLQEELMDGLLYLLKVKVLLKEMKLSKK